MSDKEKMPEMKFKLEDGVLQQMIENMMKKCKDVMDEEIAKRDEEIALLKNENKLLRADIDAREIPVNS